MDLKSDCGVDKLAGHELLCWGCEGKDEMEDNMGHVACVRARTCYVHRAAEQTDASRAEQARGKRDVGCGAEQVCRDFRHFSLT
nr:hypothetical protein CFP56_23828 [Quercus suber]